MAIQKISLKRIKNLTSKKPTVPDYDGFFKGKNGDFYVVGYLHSLSSDLDLTIQIVDDVFLINKFNNKKYFAWKYPNISTE